MASLDQMQRFILDQGRGCPSCGGKNVITDSPVTLPYRMPAAERGPAPDALPFACADCGFVLLYSLRVIERLTQGLGH